VSSLEPLFDPNAVAVIGASASPGKLGTAMVDSLRRFGGPVLLVNERRADPSAGIFASVAEAAAATRVVPDLAVFCVPAPAVAPGLREAASAGVRAAVVCAANFAEAGGDGGRHQADLAGVVAETGVRLLGPNTSGFVAPASGLVASFVPAAGRVPPGTVSLVAQSGGMLHALAFLLTGAGLGLHLGVGIGNGVDVNAAAVLDHLATTGVPGPVGIHVEGLADGRALAAAVARLTTLVPVVALVVGQTDVGDFARSHTGNLTPAWRTTRAALRQAGAVLVDDEREMTDALAALAAGRLPATARPGVAVVTGQAGPAVLLADRLRSAGVTLPTLVEGTRRRIGSLLPPVTYQANPVDTGRPSDAFGAVIAAVATDPAVDVVAAYALVEPSAFDLEAALLAGRTDGVPLLVGTGGLPDEVDPLRAALTSAGIATYDGVAGLACGVRALVDDARARHAAAGGDAPERTVLPEPFRLPEGEDEGKTLLGSLGIGTPARRACATRAEARAALTVLRPPLAVKMLEPVVAHKARVGGVHLGIWNDDGMAAALDALDRAGARRYLVEEMAGPGFDLIVGVRRDPAFGPVVLVGLGGDTADALDVAAVRLAPLSATEAGRMLDELSLPADLDRPALADVVTGLAALVDAVPTLGELEINPLRATPAGFLALDVVVNPTTAEDVVLPPAAAGSPIPLPTGGP
jgi:acetyltransferase